MGAAMIRRAFIATFRAIFADSSVLMLLVGASILYAFFYPSAYSGEVPVRMPVAVVDMDHSGASHALAIRLDALQQAAVVARPPSPADGLRQLRQGQVSAIVVIPAGFERRILSGGQAMVALYGNGAYLLRTSTALAGVGAALGAAGREAAVDQAMAQGAPVPPALAMIQRPLFNTREGYGSTIFPGVAFLIIQQTLLMGLAMLAATMREKNGTQSFAPRSLLGIALAFFVVGCVNIAWFTGFVFWFQDYPRGQAAPLTLAVSATLFVAATVAAALALGSFFRTRERPVQLWIITSVPIFFLSGLSWPTEATPRWLALLAQLLPTTAGIKLMVGINQMGATLQEQRGALINLAVLALLYGTVAVLRYWPGKTAPGTR